MTESTADKPKGKPGAPKGNRNASKHCLRTKERPGTGLPLLPKGCEYIRRKGGEFQLVIEAAVVASGRGLGIYEQARCQTASANRMFAATAMKWLKGEAGKDAKGGQPLPLTERVGVLTKISALLEASDRALRELGLDRNPEVDPWAVLDEPAPLEGPTDGT